MIALVLLRLFDYYHSNSHLSEEPGAQGRDLISRGWTKGRKRAEDGNVMLGRVGRARPTPVPLPPCDPPGGRSRSASFPTGTSTGIAISPTSCATSMAA